MNRRDLLLTEMNIPQWILVKPQVLKGDAQIRLADNIKLVVICEEDHQQTGLFQDVLRALQLNHEQYQWISLEQAMRLQFDHQLIFWLIQPEEQAVQFTKKFANQTAWQCESWQMLSQATQKRELWQQMQLFCKDMAE
ncbi:DNA polymerase III subunit psi [Glaesserella parasuis]|uniref:DNA polymerase III subunit psi n=1 Tax=Glaesserella parasuis serovar 5 (strain SH0165) TaxID=557723 RepID=B8F839_GLAP5|nr:DNA polymerase III subunit psi [Glaesserella parasuis]ACL33491.1 DNA polymerase III subunit psi [Glaesserella parasuis SH0165]MDG6280659.1 DNA polymerase III subunit psi [Glaesserella parasuis]MDG6363929.1 DNA polymerase III subunit psi [Glaesserella parasuis]MDG6480510.1 DNA polymerase III subunit psi [Glaesserella parasuis]MDG6868639.1 DNA polymerase III subunit psi [Glaesserella parasuis]